MDETQHLTAVLTPSRLSVSWRAPRAASGGGRRGSDGHTGADGHTLRWLGPDLWPGRGGAVSEESAALGRSTQHLLS